MILYARCENYRSIGESQTLSFVASTDKSHKDILIEDNIIPVIPIYGGNATGKTNILKFLKTLVEIVKGEIKLKDAYEPCRFYKGKRETIFELVFLIDGTKYYYILSYTDKGIKEESLYYYPNGKISKIFSKKEREFSFGSSFESVLAKFSKNLSGETSFLNAIYNFLDKDIKTINDVNSFFRDKFIFINFDKDKYNLKETKKMFKKNTDKEKKVEKFITYFFKHMNVGAEGIIYNLGKTQEQLAVLKKLLNKDESEEQEIAEEGIDLSKEDLIKILLEEDEEIYLVYKTDEGSVEIPIEDESEGIKKMFTLGIPIAEALCYDKILIFDELETGFHPLLSRKVVELFLSINNKAQLLFTTHDTNLLDLNIFRRDQIYFSSRTKETNFKTIIKSLGEIAGVRKSTDIEKAYLEGRYSDAPTYENFNFNEVNGILCQKS